MHKNIIFITGHLSRYGDSSISEYGHINYFDYLHFSFAWIMVILLHRKIKDQSAEFFFLKIVNY